MFICFASVKQTCVQNRNAINVNITRKALVTWFILYSSGFIPNRHRWAAQNNSCKERCNFHNQGQESSSTSIAKQRRTSYAYFVLRIVLHMRTYVVSTKIINQQNVSGYTCVILQVSINALLSGFISRTFDIIKAFISETFINIISCYLIFHQNLRNCAKSCILKKMRYPLSTDRLLFYLVR